MYVRIIVATALAVAVATPAAAQMTGSRLGKNATIHDAKAVFDNMVRCVGERSPKYAHQIMRLAPGSKAEHAKIFGNEGDLGMCMDDQKRRMVLPAGVEMTMNARMFRTNLATVMARNALEDIDASKLAQAAPWSMAIYDLPTGESQRVDTMQVALLEFGDCVVAAKPVEATAFVRHGAKSSKGSAAMKLMLPVLGSCVPQGANLEITPEVLSVALSEPIYHRARSLAKGTQPGESG